MKYLILNKNKEVVLTKKKVASGTLPDEVLQISSADLTNVANYGYVQIVDENLKPENIVKGINILGIEGNSEDISFSFIEGNIPIYNSNVTTIKNNMFYECDLIMVSLPICESIGTQAFELCTNLTTVDLPQCDYVGNSAFYSCTNLTSVSLPMCNYVGEYAFYSCKSLTTVLLPMCSYLGRYAFYACSSLTTVSLPMCSYISAAAFQYCSRITNVSLPMCSYLGSSAFNACTKLESVYLNVSSVPTLENYTFTYTPLSNSTYLGYYGSIYVPYSLYESFKQAAKWTVYADRFVSYF